MFIRLWLLTFLVILGSCEKKETTEAPRPVRTMVVNGVSSMDHQIIFPGTLRAFKRADLSFRIDGSIIMRSIYVGQQVAKGESLIRLDPREYKIALQKAKGKLESIKAQLNFAKRDFERMQNISKKDPGAISESLVDRKKETVNQLKAELIVAQSDLDKAVDDLSYTVLKSPFDGIVAAIYVENHEQVRAKQIVLRFLDIAEREMEINIPEKLIHSLLEGKEHLNFEVRLDASPNNIFKASIKEIGTEASSTTQTYPVTLRLEDVPTNVSLLAGMSGQAILSQPTQYTTNTYKIPKSAIFSVDGKHTFVWIVNPSTQTVHKQVIKTEDTHKGEDVLVQEGLQSGDRIVIAGTSFLLEGQKIKFDGEPSK